MANRTLVFAFCSFCLTLSSCAGYGVTINEQPVYTPTVAISLEDIADDNLTHCINQTLADQRITDAAQLKRLMCTSAGIDDLAGIEQLEGLEQLDLSDNDLQRVRPLLMLRHLTHVRLGNNPRVSCQDLEQLVALRGEVLKLDKPAHCS